MLADFQFLWSDGVGISGVTLILIAYFLLQIEKLSGQGLGYLLLNACGACLILVSLSQTFNLASVVIEICWLAISLLGLTKYALKRLRRA